MTAPAEQPAATDALLALAISRGVRADIPSEVQISLELFQHGSVYITLTAEQFTALLGGLVTKCEAKVVPDV